MTDEELGRFLERTKLRERMPFAKCRAGYPLLAQIEQLRRLQPDAVNEAHTQMRVEQCETEYESDFREWACGLLARFPDPTKAAALINQLPPRDHAAVHLYCARSFIEWRWKQCEKDGTPPPADGGPAAAARALNVSRQRLYSVRLKFRTRHLPAVADLSHPLIS